MVHGLYVEVEPVIMKFLAKGVNIFYFFGGRGIGKTFSAMDMCRKVGTGELDLDNSKTRSKFLYLRRTAVEAKSCAMPRTNPFKKYNRSEGYTICADFNSDIGAGNFYLSDADTEPIGYCSALSTFANLRGVDFSDVTFILYDECIPENKNKHPLKDEGFLLLNMLETINRNRALEGLGEVVLCMLSNSIDLGSPFLSQLNITPILNSMIFRNQSKYTDKSRSLHIEQYEDHPIAKMKQEESVVYKFAKGTGFTERALSGRFIDNDLSMVRKEDLRNYIPFLTVENLTVYQHKSEEFWYISKVVTPAKYVLKAFERDKLKAIFYWKYKLLVLNRLVVYDDYATKVVFDEMIKFKPLT